MGYLYCDTAERIQENLGAADVELTLEEVAAIDEKLDQLKMSETYGKANK